MAESKILEFIEFILSTDEFWRVNYYITCLNKFPHGNVININQPNFYFNSPKPKLHILLQKTNYSPPVFFLELLKVIDNNIGSFIDDYEELVHYIFDPKIFNILSVFFFNPRQEYLSSDKYELFASAIEDNTSVLKYFEIKKDCLYYGLVLNIIFGWGYTINGLEEIEIHERLLPNRDKYNLSKIENVEFEQHGFSIGNYFYLYNLFLNTSIFTPTKPIPEIINTIITEIPDCSLSLRVDENLAINKTEMISIATTDFEVFRGPIFTFEKINKFLHIEEPIIHYNPDTMNKLFFHVKPEKEPESDEIFFQIIVEELWSPEIIRDSFVSTNFIHGLYYPNRNGFIHMDYSVNQYGIELYNSKYTDNTNSGIPISAYSDDHYKVWCVEADFISTKTWSKLVYLSLSEPFRCLFTEILERK